MPIIAKKLRMSALTWASGLRPLRLPGTVLLGFDLLLGVGQFVLTTVEEHPRLLERPLTSLVHNIPRQIRQTRSNPFGVLLGLIEVHHARLQEFDHVYLEP
jgi:hypothetical protein